MDIKNLSIILKGTIDPIQRTEAEEKLNQIHKIIGFSPTLLQLVMSNDLDMPVRQAGAIYLKNLITRSWIEQEYEPGAIIPFNIHEQDRNVIRNSIVEAVIHAPDLIRIQLTACVNSIIKHDFPGRWTQIVDIISMYLQNPEGDKIYGVLLCLYQLVKNFEYKKREERAPLNEAMRLLLPLLYNLMVRLLSDQSEQSVLLQKQVLKVFFSLIQYVLPLEIIFKEVFSQWMEIIIQIIDRIVPQEANAIDEEERCNTPWWKCKKWATKTVCRVFERYGSPNNVSKEYKEFSEWYLQTFSGPVIDVLIRLLDRQRRKEYVSFQVLQSALIYLEQAIRHAHSWSFLKLHMFGIIQEVIFPLLCHTDADEELWEQDPLEYIRVTYDSYEDLLSHKTAAQNLLHSACQKRKQILPKTVQFLMQVLQMPNAPKQKDGALCMVGAIADILFKKELYKDQMEQMLYTYVFPKFNDSCGFMRARASWTLAHFAETRFQTEQILMEAVRLIVNSLLTDKELRVKVQASISLQMLLTNQDKVEEYLKPQIKNVTLEVLNVVRETKNDDLTNTLQKIISVYQDELADLAIEMCQHLATTLSQVLETSDGSIDDEYSIIAMSLLNTMETIVSVMEDQPQIIAQVRPIVLQVAVHILKEGIMEFYEEALSLLYELTCKEITPELWKVLEILYEVFQRDGADYFMDMMPMLHNFITVDTNAFLSNENYLLAIFNMCKTVLTVEMGEDPESHAAKLLEVIILQCKGRIDQCIPSFVELVLQRLTREIKTSELRIMCLQVVIGALYYNPQLLFEILNKLQLSISPSESITSHFIRQWIHDADCFLGLHDRKVCVLGLCTLMMLHPERPPVLNECAQQIIPSMILLFQGLKRAYASRAQENSDDDSDDDGEESNESDVPEVLSTDEDDINDESDEYLESLQDKVKKKAVTAGFTITSEIKQEEDDDEEDEDDADYDPAEETPLESYITPLDEDESDIDEYILFKNVLITLKERDPNFYNLLIGHLTPEQQKHLQEIIVLADQRKSVAESKKIEQAGGYAFVQQTVPTSFNFGGTPLGR